MKYHKSIFFIILGLFLMSASISAASLYFSHKYTELSNSKTLTRLKTCIENNCNPAGIRKAALDLVKGQIDSDKGMAESYKTISQMLIAFTALSAIALYYSFKLVISNKSLKLDRRPDGPPAT